MQNPRVTFQMNTGRTIVLELLPDQVPNTVRSFLWLARNSCYTGHSIQRIVPGYVVDASYNAFGKEMACYLIDNESTSHGFPNHLRLEPGTIAMGGYGELGIAGGEFFFPLAWNEKLQGNYPGFGRVIEGFDEIQRWAELPTRKVAHPSRPAHRDQRAALPHHHRCSDSGNLRRGLSRAHTSPHAGCTAGLALQGAVLWRSAELSGYAIAFLPGIALNLH